MAAVQRLDRAAAAEDQLEAGSDALPLPCHYFDFIIGTSAGG